MSDAYHVIVKTPEGELKRSDKEKESSAKKSADAFVNFKHNPAAIVIQNKRVVYENPEGAKNDKHFVQAAMKKAYSSETEPASPPIPPEKTIIPSKLKHLAAQYEKEVGSGEIVIPQSKRRADPCTVRILENACVAASLGQGVHMDAAKVICEDSKEEIEKLAVSVTSGVITLDQALEQLAGTSECCKVVNKIMETPEKPPVNVMKIMRGRKDKIFPKTRIREDIGISEEEDLNSLKNRSIPDGIVIFTTKDVDDEINGILASSMGYAPHSLINLHTPAGIAGYDYRRNVPLTRPSYKEKLWKAFGGRIGNPALLVQRIQDKFPEDKVKVEVANGVELA